MSTRGARQGYRFKVLPILREAGENNREIVALKKGAKLFDKTKNPIVPATVMSTSTKY